MRGDKAHLARFRAFSYVEAGVSPPASNHSCVSARRLITAENGARLVSNPDVINAVQLFEKRWRSSARGQSHEWSGAGDFQGNARILFFCMSYETEIAACMRRLLPETRTGNAKKLAELGEALKSPHKSIVSARSTWRISRESRWKGMCSRHTKPMERVARAWVDQLLGIRIWDFGI
jgi:hypothetical protein